MASLLKYLSPLSSSLGIAISLLCLSGSTINQIHVTAQNIPSGSGNTLVSNLDSSSSDSSVDVVYPIHGLPTGPPVTKSDRKRSPLVQENLAQNNQTRDEPVDNKTIPLTAETHSQEQLPPEDPLANPQSLKYSKCIYGDQVNEKKHPAKDTVELYEALNNIMEHVTGIDQTVNDPEEIRMRAYIGERKALGVQIILHDETPFWQSSFVGDPTESLEQEEEEEVHEDTLDDVPPYEDSSFTLPEKNSSEDEVTDGDQARIDVLEGARLRLVCNVTGVPTYWVEWRRGANLSFPGGASVVGGRSVLLDYVGREDAGTYSCTATTPSGHTHSSGVSIKVQYAPVVGVWARDVNSNKVELGCLSEGHPRPSATWYINNTRISSENCPRSAEIQSSALSSRFVLSVLTLSDLTSKDFAYYHCRASSSAGVSRSYVMLHDTSGLLNLDRLADMKPVKHPAPLENPRLSAFLLGMVPPLYIGLYIIAYLGCYKTSISGAGAHARFNAGLELDYIEQ